MSEQKNFDVEILKNVLMEHRFDIYDENTKNIKSKVDQCWLDLSNLMRGQLTPFHLYVIVKQNRYNIRNELNLPEDHEENVKIKSKFSSLADDDEPNVIQFDLSFSYGEWQSIMTTTEYTHSDQQTNSKTYYILKSHEWTNIFYEHFFSVTKLPCPIVVFKTNKVHSCSIAYLKFHGYCSECGSELIGIAYNEPQVGCPLIVHCTYRGNFENCLPASKKRTIGGKIRGYNIQKLMPENKSAISVHCEEARSKMKCGDVEPANIPSSNTLRCLKYRKKTNHKPVLAICKLKLENPYNSVIHDIGLEPFYVHYWSPTEIDLYRLYCNQKDVVPCISIDATDGIVQKVKSLSCRKSDPIFLYEITVNDQKNGTFSAAHMLSQRHDKNTIAFWLGQWLQTEIPQPKVVVTDMSKALIMASVRVFTQYSTVEKYLEVCYSLLKMGEGEVPTCLIQCNLNHLICTISTWPEMKTMKKRAKIFYLQALGLVIVSHSYSEIEELLKMIFTVALHEEDGDNEETGRPNICERAKRFLKQHIAGIHDVLKQIVEKNTDDVSPDKAESVSSVSPHEENFNFEDENHNFVNNHTFVFDLKKILHECKTQADYKKHPENNGDHSNFHYCKPLPKRILNFCNLLPMWTAVMMPSFGRTNITDSTSSSNSRFNDLKHRVFQHKVLPLCVDEFLKMHVTSIMGEQNIIGPKLMRATPLKGDENTSICISQNSPTLSSLSSDIKAEENWKDSSDEANPVRKKRKSNYLEADPGILLSNDRSQINYRNIGLLKNGNNLELQSLLIDDKMYMFRNTCPFDVVFQLLSIGYVESAKYNQFIEDNYLKLPFFEMIRNTVRAGRINSATYYTRGCLLLNSPLFSLSQKKEQEELSKIIILSCAATVYTILTYFVIQKYPSLYQTLNCAICSFTNQRTRYAIILNLDDQDKQIKDVPTLVMKSAGTLKCKCHRGDFQTVWGAHLWIETVTKGHQDVQLQLGDIPTMMKISSDTFHLRGIITYIPGQPTRCGTSLGHYIAYVYHNDNNLWEEFNDVETKAKYVRSSTTVRCQFIFFTKE